MGYCSLFVAGSPEPYDDNGNSPTLLNNNPLTSWDLLAKEIKRMKKIMFLIVVVMMSLTASAQFTVYKNVDVPSRSSSQSNYNPYRTNPYNGSLYGNGQYNTNQNKAKQYTITGYYKKSDGWYKTPIRVSVSDEEIKLVGVKYGKNWAGCNSSVSEVGRFDTEEVQENFNYKGYFTYLGTIYF